MKKLHPTTVVLRFYNYRCHENWRFRKTVYWWQRLDENCHVRTHRKTHSCTYTHTYPIVWLQCWTYRGTDVYGGQVYPSGARANQPPAAPPIQDYNLLEECPTQPGIHLGVTWVYCFRFNSETLDREESIADHKSDCHP